LLTRALGNPHPSTELRRTDFAPVRSTGAIVGIGLAVATGAAAVVVFTTTAAADGPTRLLAIGLLVALFVVAAIGVLGALECFSMTYRLGLSALEVRSGFSRLRIRYDQIEAVEGGAPREVSDRPVLWPGAYFGYTSVPNGRRAIWRATTVEPSHMVAVIGSRGEGVILTPSDPAGFKDAVIRRAANAFRGPRPQGIVRRTWIDFVEEADDWFRAGCVVALLVAAIELIISTSQTGTASRHSFAAVSILATNIVLGYTALSAVPGASRLLLGTTLCAQLIGMLW